MSTVINTAHSKEHVKEHVSVQHTKRILFFSHVLQEPFVVLNQMLDVLLSARLHASALQISALTSLRPTLAVLAFYWGSLLQLKPALLRLSITVATGLATLFFLFTPWVDSISYFIMAEACFWLFCRAAIPAQMEILKINFASGERERLFSQALSLSYVSGMIIGPILGVILKASPEVWKQLFCITAILYSLTAYLKNGFCIPHKNPEFTELKIPLSQLIIEPWRQSLRLLKSNVAFRHFQIGFFISGAGLMFAKPSIPGFLTSLNLSFLEIFSLFTLLEGCGFIVASSFWARYLARRSVSRAASRIVICFALHPLCLLFANVHPHLAFVAFFCYGVAQAGSRLLWNMAGPLLCGNESSAQYSSVNILAVGIRGAFVPVLGGICTAFFGTHISFLIGLICLLLGAVYFSLSHKS